MIRRLAATTVLAAAIATAGTGTANAAPGWDDNPNPGGGTVGLDCIYVDGASGEYCLPQYTPTRDITPPKTHLRNPFTAIWDDLSGLFG